MLESRVERAGGQGPLIIAFSPVEIERPHRTTVELALDQNAVLIDNRVVVGFVFIRPHYRTSRTEQVLVSRDRAIPVKIARGDQPVQMWMDTELAGEYGTVFRNPGDDLYVGPDYKITNFERTARDIEEGRLRFAIESMAPIKHEIMPVCEDFDAVLRDIQQDLPPYLDRE